MRLRRFDMTVTAASVALLGYFAWHAFEGPRGFHYRDGLLVQLNGLQHHAGDLTDERARLEHRVSLMRPDSIDPDMLDQLARAELEMTGPDDVVAFVPSTVSPANP